MKHVALIALLVLVACKEEEARVAPPPMAMTQEALSHYCQMNIAEHGGPKGQIHLDGYPQPLFFAQVRDLVTYVKSPEREAEITALYVSDMGVAPSWLLPGEDNWIKADQALFVVGADVRGGMGAPEIVPFGDAQGAQKFITLYGGQVMSLEQIPDEVVFGPVDLDQPLEVPAWPGL